MSSAPFALENKLKAETFAANFPSDEPYRIIYTRANTIYIPIVPFSKPRIKYQMKKTCDFEIKIWQNYERQNKGRKTVTVPDL